MAESSDKTKESAAAGSQTSPRPWRLQRTILALVLSAGAAGSAAAAYSWHWAWPGILVTLALAFAATEGQSRGRTFLLGWLTGTLLYLMGFTWILQTLREFGEMSWTLSITGLLLFSISHGLAMGLWVLLVRLLMEWSSLGAWAAFPLVYLPIEHFFPALFPWQLGAPLQAMSAFAQISDMTGAAGLTFFAALVSGAGIDLWQAARKPRESTAQATIRPARPWLGAAVAAAMLLAGTVYGLLRIAQFERIQKRAIEEGRIVRVGIVQPNIGSFEKEDAGKLEDQISRLNRLSRQAADKGAQLVLWPETALQMVLDRDEVEREARGDRSDPPVMPRDMMFHDAALLAGGLVERFRKNKESDTYNAALLITPDGRIAGVTYKVALLWFGERLPFSRKFPKLKKWFPNAGDLTPGKKPRVLSWYGVRIGVLICYEDILSDRVRQVAKDEPFFLANLTNDSWFGRSREPSQHLRLAALRAIEARRTLIRSTNTGKSAFIGPTGRIVRQTGIFEQAVLVQDVALLKGQTFFVRFGPWLVWLCLGLALVAVVIPLARRSRSHQDKEETSQ